MINIASNRQFYSIEEPRTHIHSGESGMTGKEANAL